MLVHTVYFWLDPKLSAQERSEFKKDVEILGTLKSIEKAYVGIPAPTVKRPIIDDSYSVALTVIFKDMAAHDVYQTDPGHLAFIAKWKATWTKVQIYDAI
jgi:hypothetical protein